MEISVYTREGGDSGKKINLNDSIFAVEPNEHAVYLDVKQHMANRRQGTHKSKERADISGSTRKIKKQKGTGTARAGSIKSPVFRGGGRVFGPKPRDYSFKLNKKLKVVARRSALTYRAQDNSITVVEDFSFEQAKTKSFTKLQNDFKLTDKKLLLVLPSQNKNIYLSSRNLKSAKVVMANELTTYDIMNAQQVLILESSLETIEKNLGKK